MFYIPIDSHIDVLARTRKGREVISASREVVLRFQRRYYTGKPSVLIICMDGRSAITFRLKIGRIDMPYFQPVGVPTLPVEEV